MAQWVILKNNTVVNVIAWDGQSEFAPPEGCTLVQHDFCGIGDIYDPLSKSFSKPGAP